MPEAPEYVEIHWGDHRQAYLTPVAPNEVCVTIVSSRKLGPFESQVARISTLKTRLAGAVASSTVRGGLSLSNRLRRVYRDNIALVGDASGSVDAITGEGLALSFRHALSLAEAMAANDLSLYQRAHRKIETLPHFMRRAMLLMDKSIIIQSRTLRALHLQPDLYARMVSVHVGETPLAKLGLGTLASFGWQLLKVQP